MAPAKLATLSVLSALVWWSPQAGPLAAEPVTIAALLADPQPFHFRIVSLKGTVHQVQILTDPPVNAPQLDYQCYMVHPPYTFVLADGTDFLQVTVAGRLPCVSKHAPAEPPDVAEGDTALIEARITVTHRYSEGSNRPTIQALAVGIRRLKD